MCLGFYATVHFAKVLLIHTVVAFKFESDSTSTPLHTVSASQCSVAVEGRDLPFAHAVVYYDSVIHAFHEACQT